MSMTEKRLQELFDRADSRHYKTFTEFMNMDEQSVLAQTFLPCVTFGGYDRAERVVAGFGDDIVNDDFPIVCVKAEPTAQKFADKLSHRDFLGALMNLGIKRELIGDIVIEDNCGYIFCLEHIADYVVDNLTRVRHTTVMLSRMSELPLLDGMKPQSREVLASSLRLDVLISAVYKLSRKEALQLVHQGKVFINSRLCENPSHNLKKNDMVTARGYGRFQLASELRKTKKDRLVLEILL